MSQTRTMVRFCAEVEPPIKAEASSCEADRIGTLIDCQHLEIRRLDAAGAHNAGSLLGVEAIQAERAAEALRTLDAVEKMIAILNALDGDPDREDGGDAEPSLGAPEGHESQLVWLRGNDRDAEFSPTV